MTGCFNPAGQRIEQRIYAQHDTLHSVHLLDVEFVQVLRRLVRQGTLAPKRAGEAIEDLGDLRIVRYAPVLLLQRIWQLRQNLTAYDASYVALAENLHAPLITRYQRIAAAPSYRRNRGFLILCRRVAVAPHPAKLWEREASRGHCPGTRAFRCTMRAERDERDSVKQISKVDHRRLATRKASLSLLEQMVSDEIEVYIGYRLSVPVLVWSQLCGTGAKADVQHCKDQAT